ncbi:Uncharacterized protein dnm_041840 [Desulfonema magnum]|uniref:Uncharacterized protein n=1 Tax=Desulfonema magnum TaxID=45655 RepID=A0A975BLZ5_9BACT|nr:Uncharacterized protein dnm_041840 [Desulfonema magnum]
MEHKPLMLKALCFDVRTDTRNLYVMERLQLIIDNVRIGSAGRGLQPRPKYFPTPENKRFGRGCKLCPKNH